MRKTFLILFLISSCYLSAQQDSIHQNTTFNYGNKGWELKHGDNFLMNLQWRLQFRGVVNSEDPSFFIKEEDTQSGSFNVQRARLKVGGYAYSSNINYYLEYDFPSNNLLNFEFTFSKYKAIQFKLGQWKINYNTERFISSGKQQFVDRSISNRYFTFDRQVGIMLQGNIFDKKVASSNYYIGVFNGSGIGTQNENNHYLLMGRYQWNFSKKTTKMFFSDLDKMNKVEGFIAVSAVQNTSAYTSFSSSGGGQLPGYANDSSGQFDVQQLGMELFFKYKGFSFMSENHIKKVNDLSHHKKSELYGGYLMVGFFFNQLITFVPPKLELIARVAKVKNASLFNNEIYEYSTGVNWFFHAHRNKLSADFSLLKNMDFVQSDDIYRIRLQWDVSF